MRSKIYSGKTAIMILYGNKKLYKYSRNRPEIRYYLYRAAAMMDYFTFSIVFDSYYVAIYISLGNDVILNKLCS